MFEAAGMQPAGQQAPAHARDLEERPVYNFFGATPDTWIASCGRRRGWQNGLSTATLADNFCARWSAG